MKSKPKLILITGSVTIAAAAITLICLFYVLHPSHQKRVAQSERPQPGQCPKLEGSYFGSDRTQITRGETIELRYKIPTEYAKHLSVEGLPDVPPPTIEGFTAAPTTTPLDAPEPPEFIESSYRNVKPEHTTKFILKATGPQGCQPLELPASVTVIEP